jgi:hypothetical protein
MVPSELENAYAEQLTSVMEKRDEHGRRVLIYRPGSWNPDTVSFADMFSGGFLISEMLSEEAKTQIAGITMICDATGYGFKQMINFSISNARILSISAE